MKINVIGRQMNVYDDMKALIDKKLAKLDKFFPGQGDATVTLSHKRNEKSIEITIGVGGTLFRSEVRAESFRDALDGACANIERQIRKNKTRLAKRLRDNTFALPAVEEFDDLEADEEDILRTKTYPTKPMSPEEAILQMNLLQHNFYMFLNTESGRYNVVYKREDNQYGVIEPIE